MINQDRLVKAFLDLVKIDSPSGHEDKIAKSLEQRLRALGAKVTTDSYGNVIGYLKGYGDPFMVNCHMDTVEPGRGIKPQVNGDKITSDGTTILGGDAKAGVAEILEALTSIKEDKKKHRSLEIVFTRGEEEGLYGAKNLDYSKINAKNGLTFDGEQDVSNVSIAAPGYNRVDVTITGIAAHAGAEPEKGLSSIQVASEIISKLRLGRIDHETTANIGLIEGGSARNAVPEKVHFKGEIRSRCLRKLDNHSKHFEEIFDKVMKKYPKANIDLTTEREFDPYRFEEQHPVIDIVKKAFKEMKIKPNFEESGGGTDVNIFHKHGIQALVVGTGDYDAHTVREYVLISEMLKASKFLEKVSTA
jgi:tripeptide aminopeptidase